MSKGKTRWRTRDGVCCRYGLSTRIHHVIGCPNRGTDRVEPCYLRKGKWVRMSDGIVSN